MGEGPIISRAEAKFNLGRTTFQRPKGDHLGHRSDPTARTAENHILHCGKANAPSTNEIEILFKENPNTVRVYRAAGLTDQQIYEALKHL